MKQFFTNAVIFLRKHLLAIGLIIATIVLFFILLKYESKPVKNVLTTNYIKTDSDLKLFKDSSIRAYVQIEFKKDSLQNVINVLQKENKSLSLQTSLLKFKQNKLKTDEKNIVYISDKNVSIDSALHTINRVVTKYPIKVRN